MEQSAGETIVPIWRYAPVYDRVMREGHLYPAPTCGSPSLIWHIGLAPKRRFGDIPGLNEPWLDEHKKTDWPKYLNEAHNAYDKDFESFIEELNALASRLQKRRLATEELFKLRRLRAEPGEQQHDAEGTHQFQTAIPQALSFILWWPDPEETADQVTEESSDRFLRVQTQIQVHTGYATISFIIDASKPYGKAQIETSPEEDTSLTEIEQANATTIHSDPHRRGRIRRALNIIRCSSLKQTKTRAVGKPRLPENDVEDAEAKDLLDAANYIYKDIWDEFVHDFDLKLLSTSEEKEHDVLGERFADFRGHVMSLAGLNTRELQEIEAESRELLQGHVLQEEKNAFEDKLDEKDGGAAETPRDTIPAWRPGYGFNLLKDEKPSPLSGGHTGFGRFFKFDSKRNEGHTVLRSLWPFIRRFSPWADYRELVGCGIMGWRALYVSTLGFGGQKYTYKDEVSSRDKEVPANHLPYLEEILGQESSSDDSERYKKLADYREASKPVRFLIVTKGEPHREQLGRFLERITALETGRIFALRDIMMIRNAGTHLEVIGRMLDGLLENWSEQREKVEDDYAREIEDLLKKYRNDYVAEALSAGLSLLDLEWNKLPKRAQKKWAELDERYINNVTKLIKSTERHAIRLAATLDRKIGSRGAGRVSYAIERAKLSIHEFDLLLPTLNVGDIDGWTSYPQFVDRGLRPSFDFIKTTGKRLLSMRNRLQTITETVQTAALISETEATRLNTQAIREVAGYFAQLRVGGAVSIAIAVIIYIIQTFFM